jgi:hypothetical protein
MFVTPCEQQTQVEEQEKSYSVLLYKLGHRIHAHVSLDSYETLPASLCTHACTLFLAAGK